MTARSGVVTRLDRVVPAIAAIGRPALLLAGLVAAGLALRALAPGWAGLAPSARGGAVAFVLAATLACAVGAPRQAAAFAAGYAFGFWEGVALAWLASALACAANFFWARAIARDWVRRRMGGRIAQADRFLAAHPFSATLALRLFPLGNNLAVNLAAGVSAVAAMPFLTASLLGYLPQTAIFALLGNCVHLTRSAQIAVGIALFAVSAAIGGVLFRQFRGAISASAGTPRDGAIPRP
jgi:uncharacterized membrane protein YdjX (TVP38/TMEM64 family)